MSGSSDAFDPGDSLTGILAGVDACLALVRDPARVEAADAAVSRWSVRDHVEHVLRADRAILDWIETALGQPERSEEPEPVTPIGSQILSAGAIPRGGGVAPDFTEPTGMELGEMAADLARVRVVAMGLDSRAGDLNSCRCTLPHHVLGPFTPSRWLRFLHIHHDHHAAIISDILS